MSSSSTRPTTCTCSEAALAPHRKSSHPVRSKRPIDNTLMNYRGAFDNQCARFLALLPQNNRRPVAHGRVPSLPRWRLRQRARPALSALLDPPPSLAAVELTLAIASRAITGAVAFAHRWVMMIHFIAQIWKTPFTLAFQCPSGTWSSSQAATSCEPCPFVRSSMSVDCVVCVSASL